jgi:thiamine-monophosphate kinase
MDEFEIIRRYFTRPAADSSVLIGVGDDAAVLRPAGRIVVTVDTLLEGVHFLPDAPPDAIGHRALAVSLSDVAAMGARPRWCTLALTLPRADCAWLERFAAGFFALAERHGVSLVGGNLTHGTLSVTVDVIGALPEDVEPLTRSAGRSGDDVYVTGTLGDAAGGLARLKGGAGGAQPSEAARQLIARYLRPTPRVDAGVALVGLANAAIDISDGLAADLGHLCAASGCGAVVDVDTLPQSDALRSLYSVEDACRFSLSGGDDYELCFTAPSGTAARIAEALAPTGTPVTRIGTLTSGGEVAFSRAGERIAPPAGGYLHFA